MLHNIRQQLGNQADLILVCAVVGILMILFTPIPSGLLDFLLILNFSFGLLILLLTFYVEKPLQFSTFPSLLLIATLFRLSLNIAATRLILNDADAGQVISTVGEHVVAGNYIIGLIVFVVLIVVQYVVVTNGAQRVAEVAARFTLDSMPGKQMSIDADMNIGIIDEKEAQKRRKDIEKEANFYGAMDGASKFVKGDAIAGIIIILIDIIGGLSIGLAQKGMSWGDALQTYTLLTVGDGIVTQIPALIIATGMGIIVTRAASDQYLSKEITQQITAYPKTLILIAIGLSVMLFLPGLPVLPILVVLALVGAIIFCAYRRKALNQQQKAQEEDSENQQEDLYDMMAVDPITLEIGQDLIPIASGEESPLIEKITQFRKQYALEQGLVIPQIRVKDNKKLTPTHYEIHISGAKIAEGEVLIQKRLAINPGNVTEDLEGIKTKDPSYGLPAVWIDPSLNDQAEKSGYTIVEPLTILMTHLSEGLRRHASQLLTRKECEQLVNKVKERDASMVEELTPAILPLSDIQKILQNLLHEHVSIRHLDLILEVLLENAKKFPDTTILTEKVRQRLSSVICQRLVDAQGQLYVLVFDPAVEKTIKEGLRIEAGHAGIILEPVFSEQLLKKLVTHVEQMMRANLMPILLCSPDLRIYLKQFTQRMVPHLNIICTNEVANNVNLKSFGMVNI